MSRPSIHPWRKHLTPVERAELVRLDLQIKELTTKIGPMKSARKAIVKRASKRATRWDHQN